MNRQILLLIVHANGAVGPAAVIAITNISRSSGFPRMARRGNEVTLRLDRIW